MPSLWKALTFGVIAFLFGAAAYRATTLSITVDEAYTYTQFVSRPVLDAMADYDANNHVLYTLLAKRATKSFGAGDFTLRLPALIGAALFYFALYRLVVRLTGVTWWLPLGVALIGGNTYVMDLLPLARGYGLGLALLTLGLALLLDEAPSPRLAGASLGLAVAANLTFAFPIAGLLLGLICLDRRAAIGAVAWAGGVAAALLALPLSHASRGNFYFGVDSLVTSAGSLMGVSFSRDWHDRSVPVLAGMALMAITFAATIVLFKRGRSFFLLAMTVAGGLLLLVTAHVGAGLLYPYGRTGISWLLLFGVCLTALAGRFRAVAIGATPVALAALYFYARAWSTEATVEWTWDAGTRTIAERIAAEPRREGQAIRIAASGALPHTLNYYRITRRWKWLEDVTPGEDFRQGQFDYYVMLGDDDCAWAKAQGMTVLYEHPIAHTMLAKR